MNIHATTPQAPGTAAARDALIEALANDIIDDTLALPLAAGPRANAQKSLETRILKHLRATGAGANVVCALLTALIGAPVYPAELTDAAKLAARLPELCVPIDIIVAEHRRAAQAAPAKPERPAVVPVRASPIVAAKTPTPAAAPAATRAPAPAAEHGSAAVYAPVRYKPRRLGAGDPSVVQAPAPVVESPGAATRQSPIAAPADAPAMPRATPPRLAAAAARAAARHASPPPPPQAISEAPPLPPLPSPAQRPAAAAQPKALQPRDASEIAAIVQPVQARRRVTQPLGPQALMQLAQGAGAQGASPVPRAPGRNNPFSRAAAAAP